MTIWMSKALTDTLMSLACRDKHLETRQHMLFKDRHLLLRCEIKVSNTLFFWLISEINFLFFQSCKCNKELLVYRVSESNTRSSRGACSEISGSTQRRAIFRHVTSCWSNKIRNWPKLCSMSATRMAGLLCTWQVMKVMLKWLKFSLNLVHTLIARPRMGGHRSTLPALEVMQPCSLLCLTKARITMQKIAMAIRHAIWSVSMVIPNVWQYCWKSTLNWSSETKMECHLWMSPTTRKFWR